MKIKLSKSQWEKMGKTADSDSPLFEEVWKIIMREYPDLEFELYPLDVTILKNSLKDSIDSFKLKIDYAKQNPQKYALGHEEWE